MKIVSIVGARPQFIKAAVVSRVLRTTPGVQEMMVHTGQHYDDNLSGVFFREMEIAEPAYHLGVGSVPHGAQVGRMLEKVENILMKETPDWVLVYGDTNSTLAGALAAAKLKIPLAHVEAGPRLFDKLVPEEVNRVLTDHCADLLFAPTQASTENLLREGISEEKIRQVGDVMFDAALYYGKDLDREAHLLQSLGISPRSYVLATIHRPRNTDDSSRLRAVFEGLAIVAGEIPVIVPLHPRTRLALKRDGLSPGVRLIDAVSYPEMIVLEKNAALITTDSGGVQKEAFFWNVQCVTLYEDTEWVELVDLGWNCIALPSSSEVVASAVLDVLGRDPGKPGSPYGDGHAGESIVQALLEAHRQSQDVDRRGKTPQHRSSGTRTPPES